MAFPTNPSNGQLHHESEKIWRYNNLLWQKIRKIGYTQRTVSASNINSAGGYWTNTNVVLDKPIPPGRTVDFVVNMYLEKFPDVDLDGDYAKFSLTLYENNTQIFSSYWLHVIPNTYPVDQYSHGVYFAVSFRVPAGSRYATKADFRCDWFIKQAQSGNWIQWNWDWALISD